MGIVAEDVVDDSRVEEEGSTFIDEGLGAE
jgi:hypothetical protein